MVIQRKIRKKQLDKLRMTCKKIIHSAPQLGVADKHPLQLKLDNKQGIYLHHWLWAVKIAAQKETMRRKRQVRGNIMAHIQQVKQYQQRQSQTTISQSFMMEFGGTREGISMTR